MEIAAGLGSLVFGLLFLVLTLESFAYPYWPVTMLIGLVMSVVGGTILWTVYLDSRGEM